MPIPIFASAALKLRSPRKNFGNMRINSVRDESPVPDNRQRSNSVKRKEPEGLSFASVVSGTSYNTGTGNATQMADLSNITLEVAKVSSLVDKAGTVVNDMIADPSVVTAFSAICDALRGVSTVQDKIVTCLLNNASSSATKEPEPVPVQKNTQKSTFVNLGAIAKRPRNEYMSASQPAAGLGSVGNNPGSGAGSRGANSTADPMKKKFQEVIRESERSTLVFNLNMGRIPIMNKDTLSRKASVALATLAADKEKKASGVQNNGIPSNDAIDAIDDVLSLAKNHQILGNTSKTYRNGKDPLSSSYCTAPVRYDFKDKDTRAAAEKVLRDRCGVSCTVPYPLMVRESIKQIVNHVKKDHPDNYVKVSLDPGTLKFKIARKPPKSDPDPKWKNDYNDIPVPRTVMEPGIQKVPDGFCIEQPVKITHPSSDTPMSGDEGESSEEDAGSGAGAAPKS
jgi:hypothetical protein